MNQKYKLALFTLVSLAAILVFLTVVLCLTVYFQGDNVAVLNPKGFIGLMERGLMSDAAKLMLIVVIPVFLFAFSFAWRYREGNSKATYAPDFERHPVAECLWWGIPFAIILVLATLTWIRTHELDPFKPLDSSTKPLKIQVVALDWKWLFIYPEYHVASLNFLQFPENTPLDFDITSDAPMNSFWIPQLGGQIYAMPGMRSKLHLIASAPGSFYGSSANLSGKGFAGMRFIAKATSKADFEQWIGTIKQSGRPLSLDTYKKLSAPSEHDPVAHYVLEKNDLFDWIVLKYMMPQNEAQKVTHK